MRQILWVWMLVMMTLALVNIEQYHCCLKEERIGLLEIKAWINHPNGNSLLDWVENTEDTNCCKWLGVECDNTTTRVTKLGLSYERSYQMSEDLYLNASLFLPFTELKSLGLGSNGLAGCLENQGFEVLASGLRKMEKLDLCGNRFNDSILTSLRALSSLKILDLSDNKLTTISTAINGLRELEELHVGANKFNDSVLASLNGLSSLKTLDLSYMNLTELNDINGLQKLEVLFLRGNQFNDSSLSFLSGLSSLQTLDLSYNKNLTGSTGLIGLKNLKTLYLNGIDIKGTVLIESLGALPSLKTFSAVQSNLTKTLAHKGFNKSTSLEELILSYSSLPTNFLLNMGALSTLKVLYFSGCDLSDTLPAQRLYNLTGLEELFLDYSSLPPNFFLNIGALPAVKVIYMRECDLSGPLYAQGVYNMTKLEELLLDSAYSLPTSFLRGIGGLSALRILSLQRCELNGILPDKGLCELKNLEQLYLSQNKLQGFLPPCLGNLSFLQILHVPDNQFVGNIAFSPLSQLMRLQFLQLSNNNFQVPASFGSFMNHSHLKFVACDNNELIAASSFQLLAPKFQLRFFSASNCASEPLKVQFPNFLYSQYDLRALDLSHNHFFRGLFPSWLVENNTKLVRLYLRNTSLIGPLQLPPHPAQKLRTLDISFNSIQDQITRNTCLIHPNINYLMLANNHFTGCIPLCFGNMSSLRSLDLSNNRLSCEKLERLPTFDSSLISLKLSNNHFEGRIPPSISNITDLAFLFLDGNNFEGHISEKFFIRLSFVVLDISNNLLSGMLPRGIGNSSDLLAIDLSKNHFEGTIPVEFFKSKALQFLDLSENNLSGSIPSGFNAPRLRYIHLYGNQLSGPLPHAFYNSSYLVTLDLGNNNLTGSIPNWIDRLLELSILLLRANHFDGKLPLQLCWLKKLSILDLSQNEFSGLLPSCLSNLNFTVSDDKASLIPFYVGLPYDLLEILGPTGEEYLEHIQFNLFHQVMEPKISLETVIEFTTKRNYYVYKGSVLRYMSGMDLSSNRFTGEISTKLGNLIGIYALNLSYNNLTGPIPPSFSNLKQIESLDLSYNNLAGVIPMQFTELTNLAVFNVSYNNLSGKTPEFKNQFGTFDESSYKGNHLLCGPPLQKSCSETESPSKRVPNDSNEDDGFIDMESFFVSFGVCYIIVVLTIAAVLCINPHWRRKWFYFIEECIDTCYCFWATKSRELSNFGW